MAAMDDWRMCVDLLSEIHLFVCRVTPNDARSWTTRSKDLTVGRVLTYHRGDLEKAIRGAGHIVANFRKLNCAVPGFDKKWPTLRDEAMQICTIFERLKQIRKFRVRNPPS